MSEDYQDEKFEWNLVKARVNVQTHSGISFLQARQVFDDPGQVEVYDDRENYGEDRMNLTGHLSGRLVVVTYTMRGHRRRIISARPAEVSEANDYYNQNSI